MGLLTLVRRLLFVGRINNMKKLLLTFCLLCPGLALTQTPPPAPATAVDVAVGVATYKFVSPTTLSRSGLSTKQLRLERLRQELVANGFWSNLVYLQVMGAGFNTVTNPMTLQGPRYQWLGATNNLNGEWRGELTFTNSEYYITNVNTPRLTNATIFAAWQGGQIGNAGTEKNIIGIVAADWPWNSGALRLFSSTAQTLMISTVGGGSQETRTLPGSPYDSTRFFHVGVSLEGTNNNISVWTDGWMTNTTYAHTDPFFEKITLGNGSGGGLDALNISDYNLRANIACLAIFNNYYNTNTLRSLEDIFKRTVLQDARIVFEGDSIIGYTVNSITPINRIMGRSSWSCTGNAFDISAAGNTIMDITNQWPAQLAAYARTNSQRRIVVLWAGANDVGNYTTAQRPNSEITSVLRKLWNQARGLGFEVVACTLMRRTSGTRATCLTDVVAINTQIRADVGTYYDYLVDTDAYLEQAGGSSYWTDNTFSSDGVHPTSEASQEAIRRVFDNAGYNIFR